MFVPCDVLGPISLEASSSHVRCILDIMALATFATSAGLRFQSPLRVDKFIDRAVQRGAKELDRMKEDGMLGRL